MLENFKRLIIYYQRLPMLPKNLLFHGIIFMSLILVDYILGNGVIKVFRILLCKTFCFVKKSIEEEAVKNTAKMKETDEPLNWPILLTEMLILALTASILQKYKHSRGKDRIDDLLQESRDALAETNAFLDKWRLRQVQYRHRCLDDAPQEIQPIKLEVPILHMAIVDTKGTTRSKPERGDAGDTINITDAMLLSMTSLIDENMDELCFDPVSDDSCNDLIQTNELNNQL